MSKNIKTLRNACDKTLTPILRAIYPRCLLCGERTEVAHHFVHKSKSTRLRYEFSNLIPLCHKCHIRLHHNESYEAGRIILIKGIAWLKKINKMKQEFVKADWVWYQKQLKRLQKKLSIPHHRITKEIK